MSIFYNSEIFLDYFLILDMLKKSLPLSLSFSIILLILVVQPSQTTALTSCSGRFCYDDKVSINVGDIFSWTYQKTNTGSSTYYHAIDKGLPSDFGENLSEETLIQLEIVQDFKGSESYSVASNEVTYFDTSILYDGTDEGEAFAGQLQETSLINPTIRNLQSGLVNAFEFKQSIAPNEVITNLLDATHHELETINRQIDGGVFIEAKQLEIYDSADHTNLLRSSIAVEQIDIRTGMMIMYQLELEDLENDAHYEVVFELVSDLPAYEDDPSVPALGINQTVGETIIKVDRSDAVLPLFSMLVVILVAMVVVIVVLMKTQTMVN